MIALQTFLAIGAPQIILIVVVVLLLFGGKKIPELMRGLGGKYKFIALTTKKTTFTTKNIHNSTVVLSLL